MAVGGGILGLIVRLVATLATITLHPLLSLSALPQNWTNALVSSDTLNPLLVVPGFDSSVTKDADFFDLDALVKAPRDLVEAILFLSPMIVVTALATLPYRWSVKSTAIAWIPLLWVARKAKSAGFKAHLALITTTPQGRFIFRFSLLAVSLLLAKLALYNVLVDSLEWWRSLGSPLLESFVAPGSLPRWQIVSGVNSLAYIALFFMAGNKLVEIETGTPEESLGGWYTFFRSSDVIRTFLSLYTISVLVYNVYALSPELDLPPVGDEWFPWPRDFFLKIWEQVTIGSIK